MVNFFKNKLTKEQRRDSVALAVILLMGLFQVLRCVEYPGLYLDAVNPNYLAVQILFPQYKNPSLVMPHTGFPLLGQLYHGTITVWLQLLLIAITGEASVLTLRIANMVYIVGICWLIYCICKKSNVCYWISLLGISAILLSPQVFSFMRTQYYIKLPGTLLLLLALYCLLCCQEERKMVKLLLASGVLNGLAFYSYFIFLFFVPAMLFICVNKSKKLQYKSGKASLFWLTGFCGGSIPYFWGYLDIIITQSALEAITKKIIVYTSTFFLLVVCFGFFYLIIKKSDNIRFLSIIYTLAGMVVVTLAVVVLTNLQFILSVIVPQLDSLNVAGKPMDFFERCRHILTLWQGVMNNQFSEWLMVDTTTSVFSNVYVVVFVVATICAVCIVAVKRSVQDAILAQCMLMIISYGFCSVIFISRMGGQHFTPIFFLVFLVIILEMNVIYSWLKDSRFTSVVAVILSMLVMVGVINSNLLQTNLEIFGGSNKFTSDINQLAYDALEAKKDGHKELYIFPEWGFICGFNYLTMNQVEYIASVDITMIQKYVEDGYIFKVCAWDIGMQQHYINMLVDSGYGNLNVQQQKNGNGEPSFYIIQYTME